MRPINRAIFIVIGASALYISQSLAASSAFFGCSERLLPSIPSHERLLTLFEQHLSNGKMYITSAQDYIVRTLPKAYQQEFLSGAAAIVGAPDFHSNIVHHIAPAIAGLLPSRAAPGISRLGVLSTTRRGQASIFDNALSFLESVGMRPEEEDVSVIGVRSDAKESKVLHEPRRNKAIASAYHSSLLFRIIDVPLGVYLPGYSERDYQTMGLSIDNGSEFLQSVLWETIGTRGWIEIDNALLEMDAASATGAIVHELVHFIDMQKKEVWMTPRAQWAERRKLLETAKAKGITNTEEYAYLHCLAERRAYWATFKYFLNHPQGERGINAANTPATSLRDPILVEYFDGLAASPTMPTH